MELKVVQMAKRTEYDIFFTQKTPSFINFWVFISSQLGTYRLDINTSALHLDELFTKNSVHPEHLKSIVANSLPKKSKSAKSNAFNLTIDLTNLLDALGDAAFALRQNSTDDLFDIELLEEIAWHISERFMHLVIMTSERSARPSSITKCEVIAIKNFKIKPPLN